MNNIWKTWTKWKWELLSQPETETNNYLKLELLNGYTVNKLKKIPTAILQKQKLYLLILTNITWQEHMKC